MNWIPPESETDWQESLSAYLDNELSPEERRALEERLATDGRRAEQLRVLRETSEVLQAWRVETPPPDPAFVRELHKAMEKPVAMRHRRQFLTIFMPAQRWAFSAMIFLAGIVAGVGGLTFVQELSAPRPAKSESRPSQTASPRPDALNIPISPAQAEAIRHELCANDMKNRMIQELEQRDWQKARETLEYFVREYPDSKALRELRENDLLRRIDRQYPIHIAERN